MRLIFMIAATTLAAPAAAVDNNEPNNSFENATPLTAGGALDGELTEADEDFFVIQMAGPATMAIATSQQGQLPTVDTYMHLFDGNRQEIATNDDGGVFPYSRIVLENAPAGRYFIKVRGYRPDRVGNYQILLTLSGGPDLTVSAIRFDPPPAPGQPWGVVATVLPGPTAVPATTAQLRIGDQVLAEVAIAAIAQGQSASARFAVQDGLGLGTHEVTVCADTGADVAELSEGNNCRSAEVLVGTDVVAEGLTVTPNPPVVGDPWSAAAVIRNGLPGAIAASTARLFLNDLGSADCAVPAIANGATHRCAFDNIAGLPSGITVVRVCSDIEAAIGETNEDNNCVERRLAIGSDLEAVNLVVTPVNPGSGERFAAAVTVRNLFAPATPATVARLYLGDQAWGDCAVPVLAAGAEYRCALVDLAPPPAGQIAVRFCADAGADHGERNEDNNCAITNFFNGPDLQIHQVVINPDPPLSGRPTQALVVVRNGSADPTTQITHVQGRENDQDVGQACAVGPILGGSIGACQINALQFGAGAHEVEFCADSGAVEVEVNEANNCRTVRFVVEDTDDFEPDNTLMEATLLRDRTPQDHTLHNLQDVDYFRFVVNRPSEAQLTTGPVLEGDDFDPVITLFDAQNQQLAQNNNGGPGRWDRLVREVQPGTYFARVRRGGNAAVDRYRILLRLIDLASRPPDLSVAVLSVDPAGLLAGRAFTLNSSVRNAANAGPSRGTTAVLTSGEQVLGECAVPELATDASAPCSIAVQAGLPPGEVVVRLCVDPDNEQDERREDNNCRSLPMHLFAVDEFEPDDDQEGASDSGIGGDQAHSLHVGGDIDWVRIAMEDPGTLTITTTLAPGSGGDVDGELRAPGGARLDSSNTVGPVALSYGPADRGTFLVRLIARGGQPVDGYTLTVDHEAVDGEVRRDLVLVNLVLDPAAPAPNEDFEVDVIARNDGNLISAAATVVITVDDEEASRCILAPEEAGGTVRCRDLTVGALAAGTYVLTACIDPDDLLGETEAARQNNCAAMDLVIGDPEPAQNDLRLQNPRLVPANPIVGEAVILHLEVFYRGDDSTEATQVGIAVDAEALVGCSVRALDGRVRRTASCQTQSGEIAVTQAPQVVVACVDPMNAIIETDERNNCLRLILEEGGLSGRAPDPYENDDEWANAGSLADTEAPERAQVHSLHHGGDRDVMKVTLVVDDILNIRLSALGGRVEAVLIDGPGGGDSGSNVVQALEFEVDSDTTSTEELAAGTYAILVRSADGMPIPRYLINAWAQTEAPAADAGPRPNTDAGPPGECAAHEDCSGGQRCVIDDPEPYCTTICDQVADCPEGFQLTCREVELGLSLCIKGDAPGVAAPPPAQGCSCAAGVALAPWMLVALIGLGRRRRRRRQR